MSYAGEHIIEDLKAAREAKQLSQRALGAKAGVPQSHVSKIESGAVDLQLSSLIELARLLDLELMLVPRSLVPAVRGIVRSPERLSAARARARVEAIKELERVRDGIRRSADVLELRAEDIQSADRLVRELFKLRLSPKQIETVRRLSAKLKSLPKGNEGLERVRNVVQSLQRLRNVAVHDVTEHVPARPAYRLEDEDSDG